MIPAGIGQFVHHLVLQQVATAMTDHFPGNHFTGQVVGPLEGERRVPHLGRGESLTGGVIRVLPEVTR